MKIKSLLIGMLASVALVGCTDDVLENDANEKQEVKFGDAYISLAISSSTNSSRSTGLGYGDEDGSSEDSEHSNVGTTQESAIKEVLVVLTAGTTNTNEGETNGVVQLFNNPQTDLTPSNGVQKLNTVYRMGQTGKYKALVVVNPVKEVLDLYTSLKDDHANLYNKIVEMSVSEASTTTNGNTYFMMSNKKQITITVGPEHNSESNPAGLKNEEIIEVERTISKITYRWTEALENDSKGEKVNQAITNLGANVYEIAVNGLAYQSVTEQLWFEDKDNNMKYAIFNKAKLGETEYWVLFNDDAHDLTLNGGQFDVDDIYGVYTKTEETSKGYIGLDETVDSDAEYIDGYVTDYVAKKEEIDDLTKLVLKRADNPTQISDQYFVQLEKYRLVNLNKKVYAVRHTADNNYNPHEEFGALGVDDYLVDPFTSEKNKWTSGETNDAWFNYPYLTVMNDKQTLDGAIDLPNGLNQNEDADGDGSQPVIGKHHDETGAFLTYCFENAVSADKQVFDLVTGIVFQGQMYDKNGTKISKAYSYSTDGGYTKTIYRTLRELLDNNTDITGITENSSDEDAAKVEGLEVYEDGKCFYYTSKIKHFDNGDNNVAGVMEYAIMRNNIYSLSVESIKSIGMSTLTPQSGSLVEDQSAYITMQAKILPWIVRFNDIEF